MKTRVCLMSAAVAALSLLLFGCPQTGVVCQPGTDRCGDGCADFSADRRNCGACGNACQSGQACSAGSCECAAPATTCGGRCVSTNTDPLNCGGCGNRQASYICAAGQLCEATATDAGVVAGRCKGACENPGATVC